MGQEEGGTRCTPHMAPPPGASPQDPRGQQPPLASSWPAARAQNCAFRQSETEHGFEHSMCVTQPEIKTLSHETPGRKSHPLTRRVSRPVCGQLSWAPQTRRQLDRPAMAWGGQVPSPESQTGRGSLTEGAEAGRLCPQPATCRRPVHGAVTGPGSLATSPTTPPQSVSPQQLLFLNLSIFTDGTRSQWPGQRFCREALAGRTPPRLPV